LQIVDLDEVQPEEVADLGRILRFAETEIVAGRSFEHIQVPQPLFRAGPPRITSNTCRS